MSFWRRVQFALGSACHGIGGPVRRRALRSTDEPLGGLADRRVLVRGRAGPHRRKPARGAVRPPLQGALMDPRLKAALGAAIALLYLVLRFKGLG